MALAKALESDGATAVLNRVISEQTFHAAGTDTRFNKIYIAPWLDQHQRIELELVRPAGSMLGED